MLALKTIVGTMISVDCNGRMYKCPLGESTVALMELACEGLDQRPILSRFELELSVRHYHIQQQELSVECGQPINIPFETLNNDMLQSFMTESEQYDYYYTFELDESSYWYAFSLDYVPVVANVLGTVKYDELNMVFRSIDPNMMVKEDGSVDVKVGNTVINCITTQLSPSPYHYSINFSNVHHTIQPCHNAELDIRLCLAVHGG